MYDCIIIGTGAAGVSAALTLKALKVNFLWLGSRGLSYKIRRAEQIKNYPGMPRVSGADMWATFLKQIDEEGIEITEGKVTGIYEAEGGFSVLCGEQLYEGKTVILAIGMETIKPGVGETEFLGRGVSYCAVCDGFLYKGKTIAVFAESTEETAEVELLAKYADKVYLFGSPKIKTDNEKVKYIYAKIDEIAGDMRVRHVIYGGQSLDVDGVFMLKQSFGASSLMHGLKTENGSVVVDRNGATSVAGVFAAGDCTGRPFQYAKAVGEGNVCAYSVNAYLKN